MLPMTFSCCPAQSRKVGLALSWSQLTLPDSPDPDCPSVGMPVFQTGRVLVLNSAEGQSGPPLCANGPGSDACDLLRLDTQGSLRSSSISADRIGVNTDPAASSALLSITASGQSTDIICVSSPGRTDCDIMRLSGSGLLAIAGKVVADGGFHSAGGDISTSTGSVTAGGSISTEESLSVGGLATFERGLNSSGDVLIAGGGSLVADNAFISEGLSVNGTAYLGDLSIAGVLASDTISLQSLEVVNLTVSEFSEFSTVSAENISIMSNLLVGGDLNVARHTHLDEVEVAGTASFKQSASFLELLVSNLSSNSLTVFDDVVVEGMLSCFSVANFSSLYLLGALNASADAYITHAEIGSLTTLGSMLSFSDIYLQEEASLFVSGSITTLGDVNVSGTIEAQSVSVADGVSTSVLEANEITISNSAYIAGKMSVGNDVSIEGNFSIGKDLNVDGEVRAKAITAEQTVIRSTYQVESFSASYIEVDYLKVNSSAIISGSLSSNSTEFQKLLVRDSLSCAGITHFETANVTGALEVGGTLTIAADAFVNDGGTLYVSGDITTASDLFVSGNATMFAISSAHAITADRLVVNEVEASNLTASEISIMGSLVSNGLITALEGLTSPKDIITTGDGILATTGNGDIISNGIITGKAGVTSPTFINTTGNGKIHSAGPMSAGSNFSIMGNLSVSGSTRISGPMNASDVLIFSNLQVKGSSLVNGLTSSGLIAANAGVAAAFLVSANVTLNYLVVNGLINASSLTVDTAIWTPALRYSMQPVLFSGYSDINTGKPEACSILC